MLLTGRTKVDALFHRAVLQRTVSIKVTINVRYILIQLLIQMQVPGCYLVPGSGCKCKLTSLIPGIRTLDKAVKRIGTVLPLDLLYRGLQGNGLFLKVI